MAAALSFQNIPKNEIRILIDRAPNTLSTGQNPDVMARKILPLLTELGYTISESPDLEDFTLSPPSADRPALHFRVVKDDLTRGILFERGSADVLFDTLSLSKTRYLQEHGAALLSPPGWHLSFIGFNLRNPVLRNPAVRTAVAKAFPVRTWIEKKYFGFVDPVEPLPSYDPEGAQRDLDQAGFPIKADGTRFALRYLTTPVREGNELALLTREALKKVGIRVEVTPLESSLFFSKLSTGEFELFGSRILRASPETSVAESFKTGGIRNYFDYSNEKVDAWLTTHPKASWTELAPLILEDSPLIPLFTWKHGLLLSRRIPKDSIRESDLDDSFRFLSRLPLN
ncbi:MAG: hypothetical protein EBX52_04065 [Proteobacteria bacterium]|nr:hypothetical protein [Pseudomonadota bacterium]